MYLVSFIFSGSSKVELIKDQIDNSLQCRQNENITIVLWIEPPCPLLPLLGGLMILTKIQKNVDVTCHLAYFLEFQHFREFR